VYLTDATTNTVIHHKEFKLLKIINTYLILAVIINDVNVAITQKRQADDTQEKIHSRKFQELR